MVVELFCLTLREECRLRVFENRVLRRISGPKRDEVTGEWRKTKQQGSYDVCSSPNIIWVIKSRRLRWAGHITRMGTEYEVFVGRRNAKRQLGRPRLRWENNIKMDL
jgi:hypothetical protein